MHIGMLSLYGKDRFAFMMKNDFAKARTHAENGDDRELLCITAPLPQNTTVAMAYVPFQLFGDTYDPEQALKNGTLFPELNKPYCGQRGTAR